MKPARSALFLVILAVALGACSLLLHFDPEGQPCDASGACLPGYACVNGACHASGTVGGACSPGCDAGERCRTTSATCVADVCANRLCPVGTRCSEAAGGTACVPLTAPLLGSACASDSDCDAGVGSRFCFTGAIAESPGGTHTGFCAEHCTSAFCATAGASCATYPLGLDAGNVKLCLPSGLVTSCSSDAPCHAEGFVCTVYDNPTLGPIGLCDAPNPAGASAGQSCGAYSADAGTPCADGLCSQRTVPSSATTCGELCSAACDGGMRCSLIDFTAPDGVSRRIPLCIP